MEQVKFRDLGNVRETMEEEVVSRCLRSRAFLGTLEEKKPVYETRLRKSHFARKAECNQWFADKHGIVIHHPEAIYVSGADYGDFRAIPLGNENLNYEFRHIKNNTMNLHVTKDIIALEMRRIYTYSKINVYHRRSLELVYTRKEFRGRFYTGWLNNKVELFVKEDHEEGIKILQIEKSGTERLVWQGIACCDCLEKISVDVWVFHHKNKVLRHCFICHKGFLENVDTEEDTDEYELSRPQLPQEMDVKWIDSINLLAIEEKHGWNHELRTAILLNFETGRIELDFQTRNGDCCRCYAVSSEYLVACYRHNLVLRRNENKLTNMIVKNRQTGIVKEFQVPEFSEKITSLKLLSGSILVAMPGGFTKPETGIKYERVYTMDLSEEDPRSSVLSFGVLASEVRPIGNSKIICKISTDSQEYFKIYNIV